MPARLPRSYYHGEKPAIHVAKEATFCGTESFQRASDLLVEILISAQEEHGRQWVVEHWEEISGAWFDVFMEAETLADDDWAATNRGAFVEVVKASASAGSDVAFCQGLVTFGGLGHFHRAQDKFAPADLTDGLCLKHYLLSKLTEVKANWRRGPALNRKLITYDARRGHKLDFKDFQGIAARASRILLKPGDVDIETFRACLAEDSFKEEWLATLRRLLPGFDADLLAKRPPNDKVPTYRRMIQIVYSLTPSLDLLKQYNGEGKLTAHKTPAPVSQVAGFFQRRKMTHSALALLMFSAIELARCSALSVVTQLEKLLHNVSSLSSKYAQAGHNDPRQLRLTPPEARLNEELLSLVADELPPDFELKELAALFETPQETIPSSLEEQRRLYPNGPYCLRRLGRPARSGEGAEETPGDAAAAQLAENLDATYEAVKNVGADDIKEKVDLFKKAATIIERRFQVKLRRDKEHDKQRTALGATLKQPGACPRGRQDNELKAGERGPTSEGS